ncbi:MAG: damage repair protein [Bacilli bacterium]|nr:damage repair protein [Bacilli bacterium]
MSIAVIDLKSFYASCECVCRHLDIFKTPLVCCDPYRSDSSVVMSVTPYLKEKYGVPNVCRKGDLPHVEGMIYAVPRMSYYLEMSAKVVSIFLKYVSKEDIHVYSVDESFLNLSPYLKMYDCAEEEIVKRIQKEIKTRLGLTATAGIGPNMFLAKIALDNEGKKKPPYIARWGYEDVPTKLWKIRPITKIWGIGQGISSHLERIGIRSLFELAHADRSLLEKEFGIMGDQLLDLANGIDNSNMQEKYVPKETSLSNGQTLRGAHSKSQCRLLLREMGDDLSYRLRKTNYLVGKVSLWISYGREGTFSKQTTLINECDDTDRLNEEVQKLLNYAPDKKIYGLGIAYGQLRETDYEQLSFLDNPIETKRRKNLDIALDEIKGMFGKNSVLRCSSLLPHSTIHDRHEQIGGHRR